MIVLAVWSALVLVSPRAGAAALFNAPRALEVSFRPSAVELHDLDGDLDLDLVVVGRGEFTDAWNGCLVHVFLNPGDGSFPVRTDYAVPSAPSGLVISDLNGDGAPDLATACTAPEVLQVLLNDGAGGFVNGAVIPVGIDPVSVTSADFDGDGDRDLASADQFGARVTVAINDGTAGFPSTVPYALSGAPTAIASGDVDHDLDVDLLVFLNGVLLLRNDGAGGFGPPEQILTGGLTAGGELCLFDSDGHLDLVTSTHVWLGLGNGAFDMNPIPTGFGVAHARALDFDQDGFRDVVTSLGIAPSDGLGGFRAPLLFESAPSPGPVGGGDVDGDGIPDLVRLQAGVSGPLGFAVVRLGLGDGGVTTWPRWSAGNSVWALAAADMDRDGMPDAVVGNMGTGAGSLNASLHVLRGAGDGTLGASVSFPAGNLLRATATGDLDEDGAPDVVAANRAAGTVSVFLNDGAGGLAPRVPLAAGTAPEDVILADLDGDQHLDIAVCNSPAGATTASVTILHGDGSGAFPTSQTVALSGNAAVRLVAEDLDGNGWRDLAVVCSGVAVTGSWTNYGLFVLPNQGSGSFGPEESYATSGLPRAIAVNRVDDDGDPDLVVTTMDPPGSVIFSGRVQVFRNDGTGHFGPPVDTPHLVDHFNIACTDFDGDGRVDLALPYLSAGVVSVMLGDGTGAFPRRVSFATGTQPRAVALADFDGDGSRDLAVAHSTIHQVGILLSRPATLAVGPTERPRGSPGPRVRSRPNPFRSHTSIVVESAPAAGTTGARLVILDIAGREVRSLPLRFDAAGRAETVWDGSGASGGRLPSGIYFLRYPGDRSPAGTRLLLLN